jgi:hypothetical protein
MLPFNRQDENDQNLQSIISHTEMIRPRPAPRRTANAGDDDIQLWVSPADGVIVGLIVSSR